MGNFEANREVIWSFKTWRTFSKMDVPYNAIETAKKSAK
jgi:hypothetical protein